MSAKSNSTIEEMETCTNVASNNETFTPNLSLKDIPPELDFFSNSLQSSDDEETQNVTLFRKKESNSLHDDEENQTPDSSKPNFEETINCPAPKAKNSLVENYSTVVPKTTASSSFLNSDPISVTNLLNSNASYNRKLPIIIKRIPTNNKKENQINSSPKPAVSPIRFVLKDNGLKNGKKCFILQKTDGLNNTPIPDAPPSFSLKVLQKSPPKNHNKTLSMMKPALNSPPKLTPIDLKSNCHTVLFPQNNLRGDSSRETMVNASCNAENVKLSSPTCENFQTMQDVEPSIVRIEPKTNLPSQVNKELKRTNEEDFKCLEMLHSKRDSLDSNKNTHNIKISPDIKNDEIKPNKNISTFERKNFDDIPSAFTRKVSIPNDLLKLYNEVTPSDELYQSSLQMELAERNPMKYLSELMEEISSINENGKGNMSEEDPTTFTKIHSKEISVPFSGMYSEEAHDTFSEMDPDPSAFSKIDCIPPGLSEFSKKIKNEEQEVPISPENDSMNSIKIDFSKSIDEDEFNKAKAVSFDVNSSLDLKNCSNSNESENISFTNGKLIDPDSFEYFSIPKSDQPQPFNDHVHNNNESSSLPVSQASQCAKSNDFEKESLHHFEEATNEIKELDSHGGICSSLLELTKDLNIEILSEDNKKKKELKDSVANHDDNTNDSLNFNMSKVTEEQEIEQTGDKELIIKNCTSDQDVYSVTALPILPYSTSSAYSLKEFQENVTNNAFTNSKKNDAFEMQPIILYPKSQAVVKNSLLSEKFKSFSPAVLQVLELTFEHCESSKDVLSLAKLISKPFRLVKDWIIARKQQSNLSSVHPTVSMTFCPFCKDYRHEKNQNPLIHLLSQSHLKNILGDEFKAPSENHKFGRKSNTKAKEKNNSKSSIMTKHGKEELTDSSSNCSTPTKRANLRQNPYKSVKINFHIGYSCPLCTAIFQTEWLLLRHSLSHRKFICNECDAVFSTESSLSKHLTKHLYKSLESSRKLFSCPLCQRFSCICYEPSLLKECTYNRQYKSPQRARRSFPFRSKPNLGMNDHLKITIGSMLHKFGLSNGKANEMERNHNLLNKRITDLSSNTFECNCCDASFFTQDQLDEHLILHNFKSRKRRPVPDPKVEKLPKKPKKSPSKITMHDANANSVSCVVCRVTFNSYTKFRRHFAHAHDDAYSNSEVLSCANCDKIFHNEYLLRHHMKHLCQDTPSDIKDLLKYSSLYQLEDKGFKGLFKKNVKKTDDINENSPRNISQEKNLSTKDGEMLSAGDKENRLHSGEKINKIYFVCTHCNIPYTSKKNVSRHLVDFCRKIPPYIKKNINKNGAPNTTDFKKIKAKNLSEYLARPKSEILSDKDACIFCLEKITKRAFRFHITKECAKVPVDIRDKCRRPYFPIKQYFKQSKHPSTLPSLKLQMNLKSCILCSAPFSNPSLLLLHSPKHKDSTEVFECSHCKAKSLPFRACVEHLLYHSGKTPYHCHFCSEKFSYSKSLIEHLDRSHGFSNINSESSFRWICEDDDDVDTLEHDNDEWYETQDGDQLTTPDQVESHSNGDYTILDSNLDDIAKDFPISNEDYASLLGDNHIISEACNKIENEHIKDHSNFPLNNQYNQNLQRSECSIEEELMEEIVTVPLQDVVSNNFIAPMNERAEGTLRNTNVNNSVDNNDKKQDGAFSGISDNMDRFIDAPLNENCTKDDFHDSTQKATYPVGQMANSYQLRCIGDSGITNGNDSDKIDSSDNQIGLSYKLTHNDVLYSDHIMEEVESTLLEATADDEEILDDMDNLDGIIETIELCDSSYASL